MISGAGPGRPPKENLFILCIDTLEQGEKDAWQFDISNAGYRRDTLF